MPRTKVFLAMPTIGEVTDATHYFLREIESRYKDDIELVYPKECVRRVFHDYARNSLVEEFLESDCDILWFLDSDVTPPKHILDLVTLHGSQWKIAGAPYPIFTTPTGGNSPEVVIAVYREVNGGLAAAPCPRTGTGFVDGIATGCLFIRREVFAELDKPYFEFKFDASNRSVIEGEDLGFCLKMHKKGIQFFVDFDMVCKHRKMVCLLDVNNYAITYSNRNVVAYDAQIRADVARLAQEVVRLRKENAELRAPKQALWLPK